MGLQKVPARAAEWKIFPLYILIAGGSSED